MVLCDSTFYSTATFRQSFYNSDLFKVLQDVTKNVSGGSPSEVFRPNSLSVCTTIHTLQCFSGACGPARAALDLGSFSSQSS